MPVDPKGDLELPIGVLSTSIWDEAEETEGNMGNENLAGLRLAFAAASVTLATAGVYVATMEEQATAPSYGVQDTTVSASIGADVERVMLTAHVVSQGPVKGATAALDTAAAPSLPEGETPSEPAEEGEPVEPGARDQGDDFVQEDAQPRETQSRPRRAAGGRTPTSHHHATTPAEAPGAHRNRMSDANVRARRIAIEESSKEAQRLMGGGALSLAAEGSGPEAVSFDTPDASSNMDSPQAAPKRLVGVDKSLVDETSEEDAAEVSGPRSLGSDLMDKEDRHLLFVWDSGVILDEERSAELLKFAEHRGYDTLAVEATGVGYRDAALTDAFARFTAHAADAGVEIFALIGYPWFTVAANAGLPGQPTSSLEGLAVLDVIASTRLFDGVVDDSHPYGVVYEVNGESYNRLFDEPAAASLDLQAWLRSAKDAIGDLPLIKTTPFWYDSHPSLQEMVSLEGEEHLTLGHLIASEVDAMAVLAYRDQADGPNGLLELIAGEMSMGPSIITLETADLGSSLDYLTFHEEGLRALEDTTEEVLNYLVGHWAFGGVGVHHYAPALALAGDLAEKESFGFVSIESASVQYGALIDAYDSSLGTYTEQLTFNEELDTMTGIGLGAIVSNGDIALAGGALVHGDARSGQAGRITDGFATEVTGESISISTPIEIPVVDPADTTGAQDANLGWNTEGMITGDLTVRRLNMNSYSRLSIVGPATVVIDELQLNSNAYILADTSAGPVTLIINSRLSLGFAAYIAPSSLQARDMTIRYAGTSTIQLNTSARLLADIVAPLAQINLGYQSEIYGRALAKSLFLGNEAKLHLDIDLLR